MEDLRLKKLLLGTSLLAGMAIFGTVTPAFAQDSSAEPVTVTTIDEEDEYDDSDDVIVTGSRIKKDSFSSVAPLQVLSVEDKLDVGLINPVDILQQTESAAGQQIDSTFQGFVLDNGPGSETLNLRGLGADRTLIMINGRRLGPIGVEGAPSSPSINLIPGSLIESYDLLLDGASSVYGSDAVAGVANAVLRKDFEGFELNASGNISEQAGNTDYVLSGNWGTNTDRAFLGIGVEYEYQDEVTFGDRDFLRGCETHVEIDQEGNRYRRDRFNEIRFAEWFGGFQAADGNGPGAECKSNGIAGRIIEQGGIGNGSIYSIPGTTNIGIPGFIDQTFLSVPIDGDGDGVQDYGFQEFAINGNDLESSLFNEQEQVSLMAYGEYVMDGEMQITPFFEAMYVDFSVQGDSGTPQLFPSVSANNPFNPCNPAQPNGVDCGLGQSSFTTDPGFVQRWNTYYRDRDPNRDGNTADARICATFAGGLFDNAACTPALFGYGSFAAGPIPVLPVAAVDGDRDQFAVDIGVTRLIGGFKGELPFLDDVGLKGASFETSVSYHKSDGDSSRMGIRGDRLAFALGDTPCVAAPGTVVAPDVSNGCVPVNMFAPSLYPAGVVGDFATAAERNYLFDSRDFNTVIEQTIWNGFVSGTVASLPAGNVGLVLGGEVRIDEIDSNPDDVARDGLFFGFFSDGGAVGEKTTKELFAEVSIPLVADRPYFKQLDINGAARMTNDEFYGTNFTYSGQVGWRPFDSLLLKGTIGTSFRAPNLRENFLAGTSGFIGVFDPCIVPLAARSASIGGGNAYDAANDTRDPDTLARCLTEGVDPTMLGLNPGSATSLSTEVSTGGRLDLREETSDSYTLGFSFEQPFFDDFDLSLGATYYNIDIVDGIVEAGSQFIVNDCFTINPGVRSARCDDITRDADGFIDLVSGGFINLDTDKVAGIDFNVEFAKEFNAFDTPMEFGTLIRANHLTDRSFGVTDSNGDVINDTLDGEFGFPDWTGTGTFWVDVDSTWRVIWEARYIDGVTQDADGIDAYSDVFDSLGTGFTSDTCGGLPVGEPICRDVGFAKAYDVHTLAFRYAKDSWRFGAGVNNIFATKPPEVDGNEVFSISNTPIGNGYDLNGRTFFANVRKRF